MVVLRKVMIFLGCLVLTIVLTKQPLYLSAQEKDKPIHNNYLSLSSDLEKIKNTASKVAVKIYKNSPNQPPGGSGFIIRQIPHKGFEGKFQYFVLTNKHVIDSLKDDLRIITADNQSHPARPQQLKFSKDTDLGLLYFYSENIYLEAKLNTAYKFQEREKLAVFGFPCEYESCKGSKFAVGRVGPINFLLPDSSSLFDGYSLPYDFSNSEPEVGMSGSPVFNLQGEVVAVHGKGKYIQKNINNDSTFPYLLDNGKKPSIQVQSFMYFFFWAIPLTKIHDSNIDQSILVNAKHVDVISSNSYFSSPIRFIDSTIIACIFLCLAFIVFFWRTRKYIPQKIGDIYSSIMCFWSRIRYFLGKIKAICYFKFFKKRPVSKDQQLIDLVKGLNLAGNIVVVDATGCQQEMAKIIIERQADYVVFAKENSGDLYEQVEEIFLDAINKKYKGLKYSVYNSRPVDGKLDNDNTEYCITQIMTNQINSMDLWTQLNSIGMMRRLSKNEHDEIRRYFVSSLDSDIQLITEAIRDNWSDEKKSNKVSFLKRTLVKIENL
jgi:predicted transposase YbfD/YdcC